MADNDAVRSRRYKAHRNGDHSMCRPDRPCRKGPPPVLRLAGAEDTPALMAAVRVEFADADPMMQALAFRLAEMANGHGAAAVQAVRQLAELTASYREQS